MVARARTHTSHRDDLPVVQKFQGFVFRGEGGGGLGGGGWGRESEDKHRIISTVYLGSSDTWTGYIFSADCCIFVSWHFLEDLSINVCGVVVAYLIMITTE